jgi:hypothetical protein
MPEFMQTVYKTTNSIPRAYRRQFLLKPGTIVANEQCKFDYTGNLELFGQGALVNTGSFTPYSSDLTSFDIRDYFTTNLRDGIVHLVFFYLLIMMLMEINWFQITFVLNILKLFKV